LRADPTDLDQLDPEQASPDPHTGRLLVAVHLSIGDLLDALAAERGSSHRVTLSGLHGGWATARVVTAATNGLKRLQRTVELVDWEYLPGLRISGTLSPSGYGHGATGTVAVSGLASGQLIVAGEHFEGQLDGQPASWTAPTSD
jgi:hypothetical protein